MGTNSFPVVVLNVFPGYLRQAKGVIFEDLYDPVSIGWTQHNACSTPIQDTSDIGRLSAFEKISLFNPIIPVRVRYVKWARKLL